jgi:hypothetical protein
MMAPESLCDPCNVVIAITFSRNKNSSTGPHIASRTIYMDHGYAEMLPTFTCQDLTPSTTFHFYLILVENTSRKPQLLGIHTYTLDSVHTYKRQVEEAGLAYTEDFTVDLLFSIINKFNKPEYSVKTNIYMEKRGINTSRLRSYGICVPQSGQKQTN